MPVGSPDGISQIGTGANQRRILLSTGETQLVNFDGSTAGPREPPGQFGGSGSGDARGLGLGLGLGPSAPPVAQFIGLGDIFSGIVKVGKKVFGGGDGNGNGCAPGYERDNRGRCIKSGFGGAVERFFPGGKTGTQSDVFGEAVMGGFGVPALVPFTEMIPRSSCPAGMILGQDNLCYRKGSIPMNLRKWKPGTKPFLSGGDVKCLRRANRLRKSKGSKRLLRELGMG